MTAPTASTTVLEDFEDFEIRASSDLAKYDSELICPHCDGVVCDVESNDTLGTLVRVVRDHLGTCTEAVTA